MRALTAALVILMILGSALVPIAHSSSGQVVLTPTDDAYTNDFAPESNFVSQQVLKVGESYNSYCYYTWLKFSLSGIPKGAVGVFGMLELCTTVNGIPSGYAYYLCQVSACWEPNNFNQWTEKTITSINTPYNASLAHTLDTAHIVHNEVWYAWDVTEAVVNVTASNATKLTISMYWRGHACVFSSKEGTLGRTPKLTVSWTNIVPEFPSVLILPILMLATLLAVAVSRRRQTRRAKRVL